MNELIKAYCDLEENKNVKDYTLAKKIMDENPGVFKTLENTRSLVRYCKGHFGNKQRKYATHPKPLNYDTMNTPKSTQTTPARVLILDIETAPMLGYIWGMWKQNVAINQLQSDWFCFTWAAKWLFEDRVYSYRVRSM